MSKTRPAGKVPTACVALFLIALTPRPSVRAQESRKQSESADAYEAVIRYQIRVWNLAADSYCISVNGRDATEDFLQRFDPLPVKAASNCRKQTKEKVMVVVLDKKTGKRSVIFDVETIRWSTDNDAEVEGGYYCGSLCSASGDRKSVV